MFLEDERAAGRLRVSRFSLSLMVAAIAFVSCVVAAFGLFSVADATPAMASAAPDNADRTITHGLTLLFAALVAANGFAIWLRRIRSLVVSSGKNDGR
jgi:hypothetical protein